MRGAGSVGGGGGGGVRLPEAFGVGDEEVGVGRVAVATRHLDRTGAVPGGWKRKNK